MNFDKQVNEIFIKYLIPVIEKIIEEKKKERENKKYGWQTFANEFLKKDAKVMRQIKSGKGSLTLGNIVRLCEADDRIKNEVIKFFFDLKQFDFSNKISYQQKDYQPTKIFKSYKK